MASPLLALFIRSLREDVRGKTTYLARGALAGFTLLITLGTMSSSGWQGAPGLSFFSSVIALQAVCVAVAGLSYFASAITEEKEEMMLGLLRMTNLSAVSILLGKSTSRLCGALLLLAAQLPFAPLAVTLGGVSAHQIVTSLLALGAFTFLLCNLALLASVLAARTAGAAAVTAAALAIYLGAGPLLGLAQTACVKGGWVAAGSPSAAAMQRAAAALTDASVAARLVEVLRTGFGGPPLGWQVVSNVALGVVCFLGAWAAFARFSDRATEGAAPVKRHFLGRRRRPPPRPWRNALAWKEFHFACGGWPGFTLRCLGYGAVLAVALIAAAMPGWGMVFFRNVGFSLSSVGLLAFSIETGVMASRLLGTERREQTLAIVAGLPLSLRELLHGKARGCLLAAAPGIVATTLSIIPFFTVTDWKEPHLLHILTVYVFALWCSTAFLACLVAFLSLYMMRGALPLGLLISFGLHNLLQMLIYALVFAAGGLLRGTAFGSTLMVPGTLAVFHIVLSAMLYRAGLRRLESIAGES